MAISSIGIGSGLEVESIITQMIELEKRPIKTLEVKAEFIDSKISVQGELRSLVTDLNDAVLELSLDRTWNSIKVNASAPNVSAVTNGIASPGSYNLNVTHLARSHTMVSENYAADYTAGSDGEIVFTVGAIPGGAAGVPKAAISISAGDSLERIASKISSSDSGVLASVITNASGQQQLMLRSRETGLASGFTFTSDVASLNSGTYTVSQTAQNAALTINGVAVESNSNTFTSTLPGLSISVAGVGESILTVATDKDAIKEKIQKFFDSYNALNQLLTDSTKYSEDKKTAGIFQGDSTIVSMQNAFRMLTQINVANTSGAFKRLSDIGIEMGNSITGSAKTAGELILNVGKLDLALNDIESLKSLFASKEDAQGASGGIAVRFKNFTGGLMDLEGALNKKDASLDNEKDRNADEQTRVEKRATALEARLRKQYTALDVKMASLNSLSSYVEQMVSSWNKSKD